MSKAAAEAIADAGLETKDIDGFLCGMAFADAGMLYPASVAEVMGINPRMLNQVDIGGASPAGMVWRAAAAIHARNVQRGAVRGRRPEQIRRPEAAGDLGAARVRGALRKYRRQLRLRDDRQPPHVRVRHHGAADGESRGRPAQERGQESAGDVQRSRAHDRRRAQFAHDLSTRSISTKSSARCSGGSAVVVASPEDRAARQASAGLAAGRGRILQPRVDHLCAVAYRLAG